MNRFFTILILITIGLIINFVLAHSDHTHEPAVTKSGSANEVVVQSDGGDNPWNRGIEPDNPWAAIEQMHGHVGPWNVLGWRIGQKALADFDSRWGGHELDITVYIPMSTPYSCIADGLVVGTGNSIGRLDIRLAQVPKMEMICVGVSRKNDSGETIIYKPSAGYLKKILNAPVEDLSKLSKECFKMKDEILFDEERI